jgi:ABC-type branched-subunit amino acid transport system substrate-binding protein
MEQAHESEFTDAVVRGLETGEADLDDDDHVSAYELYQYVLHQVRQNKPGQTPTISGDRMVGELHLAKNPHAPLPLPTLLEQALTSKIAWERSWAMNGLKLLLAGDHSGGQKRTARQVLIRLGDKDPDHDVQEAAREASPRVLSRDKDANRPSHSSRRLRWFALGVALGVVLTVAPAIKNRVEKLLTPEVKPVAACSPSVKPADGVLSFGTLLPKTGAFVYTGPPLDAGVHLAMKDINDAGGIPGIVVKLDEANQRDEGNPSADTASRSTDALLAGGVDVIIGPATSAVAVKVIDTAICAGVIMFSPSNTSSVFTTYSDHGLYFRTEASTMLEGSVLGRLVAADGNSTAVVMSRDDPYGNDLQEDVEKTIRESGGRILDSIRYDPNARGHDKEIQRVKAKNPDAIVLIGFTESAQILANMIKNGLTPGRKRVYGSSANMTNTLAGQVSPRDPGVLAGMKGTLPGAGGDAFVKRLREANPGLRDLTYAAQAYDAVVITALAAAVAGTDEPAAIAKEINGVTKTGEKCTSFATCMTLVRNRKDIDYDGPSGTLEFADPGEPSSATYVISEIQADGTVKPLRTEKVG